LLGLVGILLSAAIALSSTTFLGNILAGLMLRAIRGFRPGDFVRVGDHFGRVTELGLFHVEIQNEDRDLTTMPNLHLVTNPVKVIRSDGTFVSAEVSLGYDAAHEVVEPLLLRAAAAAELKEPFVQVLDLGDFSVTYRVAGLLQEVKHLISARSRLRSAVLDELHGGGIEIVSPTLMTTRNLPAERRIIPKPGRKAETRGEAAPETLVFDKADQAESLEKLRSRYDELGRDIQQAKERLGEAAFDSERADQQAAIERLVTRRERIAEYIKRKEEEEST